MQPRTGGGRANAPTPHPCQKHTTYTRVNKMSPQGHKPVRLMNHLMDIQTQNQVTQGIIENFFGKKFSKNPLNPIYSLKTILLLS
jgi:hypothetical protein